MNLHVVLLYCIQTRDENSVSRKRGFNKKPVSTFRGCHLISNKWWCPKSEILERACVHFYGYSLLTAMRNRTTLLRAEQSRAEAIIVPFLHLAAARRLKQNTAFVMDNRRIWRGKYALSGSAVFCVFNMAMQRP